MGIKQEIAKRFTDTHIDLRAYWEQEKRIISKSEYSYISYHLLVLAWVPIIILILPTDNWALKMLALFAFIALIFALYEEARKHDSPRLRLLEIKHADRNSWHAQFNGWAYEVAHQKIHARMKQECDQITREGMWKIEKVLENMNKHCTFTGSIRIDSAHRNQPAFEYDFKGIEGCQLRLYRHQGAMLESVEDVIKTTDAILIMQKYEPEKNNFIDYDAKDGQTYNYYAFLYVPLKTSKGEVVTTQMKLLYPEPLDKISAPKPTFVTVIPKEFQANLAHGFIAERVTVPKHITAEERAKFEAKKLQAKGELRSMQEMLSFKSDDVVKRMKVILKEVTNRESRQKQIDAAIELVITSQLSDAAKEQTENELMKLID